MRDRAQHMAEQAIDKVHEAASKLAGTDQQSNGPGGNRSTPVMDQATEQVTSRVDMGKEYVAETMTGVAQALRKTGQHLREDGSQPMLAQFADRGAERIEHFGGYLKHHDTSQLINDVEGFARRQPMVFASGAFALGMLAVRFLRSGGSSQQQGYSPQGSASYGGTPSSGTSYGRPPMAGQTGTSTSSGTASSPPRTYTGAAQDALRRASGSGLTSGSVGNTGSGTGAPSGAGVSAPSGATGTQSDRPAPRPASAPTPGGTSTGSGATSPRLNVGPQTGTDAASCEDTEVTRRIQP
jgi:hypothetical protein